MGNYKKKIINGWIVNLNNDEIYSAILSAKNLDIKNLKKMGNNARNYIKNHFFLGIAGKRLSYPL